MVEVSVNRKPLVCVEYPAIVQNVDKMILSLGGEDRISQVYSDPCRRMDLRFRPGDILCKAVCGDRVNTTCMVIRVKRRRKRSAKEPDAFQVTVEGVVNVAYKFRALADFQYLPMCKQADGTYKNVLPELAPTGLPPPSWMEEDTPAFIIPPMFSRLDTPSSYHRDPIPRKSTQESLALQKANTVIYGGRKRRIGYALFVSFDEKEIPKAPMEKALENFNTLLIDDHLKNRAKQLFEERPIWTRAALLHTLQCDPNVAKMMLPALSYYFLMGPWRATWVRFGYDPRKDPKAKIYQVLDYRLRYSIARYREAIKPKRSTHSYTFAPLKANPGVSRAARIQLGEQSDGASSSAGTGNEHLQYQFIPGQLPPHHQIYYQLCDIKVDEIQNLVHANDGKEGRCHEKDGWLSPGTLEKCRQILFRHVKQTLAELNKGQDQSSTEQEDDEAAAGDEDEMGYPSDQEYDPMEDDDVLMYMDDTT